MFSIEFASVKGSLFLLQKAPSILPLSLSERKWRPPRKIRQKKISFKSTAKGISLLSSNKNFLNKLQEKENVDIADIAL